MNAIRSRDDALSWVDSIDQSIDWAMNIIRKEAITIHPILFAVVVTVTGPMMMAEGSRSETGEE